MKPTKLKPTDKELFLEKVKLNFESLPEVTLIVGKTKDKLVLQNEDGVNMEYDIKPEWNILTEEGRKSVYSELYGDEVVHLLREM